MPTESGDRESFWKTLPGIITAISALVGALVAAGIIHASIGGPSGQVSAPSVSGQTNGPSDHPSNADVQNPETPPGFDATNGVSGVALLWSPASDNVGVVEYIVFRDGDTPGYEVQHIDTSVTAPIDGHFSWLDDSVAEGSTHSYFLVAIDAAGNRSTPAHDEITFQPQPANGGA